jgi:hypothetical protein
MRQARQERTARGLTIPGVILLLLLVPALGSAPSARGQGSTAGHFYNSLRGLHVAGCQGWFDCPNDGAGIGWGHWFQSHSDPRDPNSIAFDIWPDTSDLEPDELCPTAFHLPSGAPAYLFSSANPKTVARHFRWMREYGIDGAAMQRFTASLTHPAVARQRDIVLRNARAGAEANRRGFFIMYDVTGMKGDEALRVIEQDWPHLTQQMGVIDSPSYIYHRGRPLVGVWGFGFKDRNISPDEAASIIRYLKTGPVPATVLGGVPASWRNLGTDRGYADARIDPGWPALYRSFDVISPWTVGRFRDEHGADDFARRRIVPDIAETSRLGIDYMPVVFPGYSRTNGARPQKRLPLNLIPRRCGAFYDRQVTNATRDGARMLYTAMFDELNEGTAIFKSAARSEQEPTDAQLITLGADGCGNATTDMYLRLAGRATKAVRGRP